MVLQADMPAAVWGKAAPDTKIDVSFIDQSGKTLARMHAQTDSNGDFSGKLDRALPCGITGKLLFENADSKKEISDVLTGEVWLASGQSNMGYSVGAHEWPSHVVEKAREEVLNYEPNLRFFNVAREGADNPRKDLKGQWIVADYKTVRHCSAVAWNFAVEIHEQTDRPVGIVLSSIGGTPIESWVPQPAMDALPIADILRKRHENALKGYPEKKEAFDRAWAAWEKKYPTKALQQQNWPSRPREPYGPTHTGVPARLYNAMVAPLAPLSMRGIIWYQGENNSDRPQEYPALIKALITSWRANFGRELPFYYVEVANFKEPQKAPVEDRWTLIREAQAAALELPKTGVACAIDLGQADNVHYWNKKPVGIRLARMALADCYGLKDRWDETRCPAMDSFEIKDNRVILHIAYAGKGLKLRDGIQTPQGFAIRGKDGDWKWAGHVELGKNTITVWDDAITAPAAVRYAWAQNPLTSVENSESFPLRPFRTDKESEK